MKNGLQPSSPEAFQLLMEGSVAMSRIESTGIRIDVSYLKQAIKDVTQQICENEERLKHTEEYRVWAREYGNRMTLDGNAQLGHVIFDILGHKRNPHLRDREDEDRLTNQEAAFEHLSLPFLKDHFTIKKLRKGKTTLRGILEETVDGRLHPFFNLHTAESYRSSCSNPNVQNIQVRNKLISEIVRTCIVPDPGCVLIEFDYSAQEVRVAACYNRDPKLIEYILGGGDMHKERAMELYLLSEQELGPCKAKTDSGTLPRYCSKNMFVFPQFYGSVYVQCAPNLWEAIARMDLRRVDGVSLYDHLKEKGIKKLGLCDYEQEPRKGTFEYVVAQAENRMWKEVFTVYDQWKRDWWTLYQNQGGVNTLTGFRMEGLFRRNQILCDPIQGSAFHCLLWSIINIQRNLLRRRMHSRIICQIHDSGLACVPVREVKDFVELVREIAVRRVAKHWPWIIVPLSTEFEVAESNWAKKHPLEKQS